MNSQYRNQRKVQKAPLPPYLATPRPCLDSLHLPISRPCQYHPVTRPAVITSSCYQSCADKLPVCHCVNDNYCTTESCSNSNSCKRSNPYLCPHGINNLNSNRENVEENGISDEEFCDDNEFNGNPDKTNLEKDSVQCEEGRSDRIPLRDSFLNTNSNLNNTLPDNIQNEQEQSSRLAIDRKYNDNKDLNTCCLKHKDRMNSNVNTINNTSLADPETSQIDENINAHSSNFHINNRSIATPEVRDDGNQVPNDMSLTGFHKRYLHSSQDLNKSSQPTMFGSAPKLSQADKSTIVNKNFASQSGLTPKNDASNQCCLPPYIHAVQHDTSKNYIEDYQSLRKQGQSSTYFNNLNDQIEHISNQNTFENTAASHLASKDNLFPGNVNETTKSKNRFSKISQSTNTSNKQHQSLQSSLSNEQMITDQVYKDHNSFSESVNKSYASKAGCCASGNHGKNIQVKSHPDNVSNNNYYPGYLPNQAKSGHRAQLAGDPTYDNEYDTTVDLSYRQGSVHYDQGFNEFDAKNKKRKSEYKRNKIIQKSSGVECACSKYYKRKSSNEKDVQCRKNACTHEMNSSACASVSCVVNQAPVCRCRYPPAFKQYNCVGNITGGCNCSEYNY